MSNDDSVSRQIRSVKSSYYVRKSEELMRKLEKENFNLKLKIFYMEQKKGNKVPSEANSNLMDDVDMIDVILENETLKAELNDKKETMTEALHAIELLEKRIEKLKTCSHVDMQEFMKRIQALKIRSKMYKRKLTEKRNQQVNSRVMRNLSKMKKELFNYISENTELSSRMHQPKNIENSRNKEIDKLSAEKAVLLKKFDEANRKITEKNNIIKSLNQELLKTSKDYDTKKLIEENEHLKSKIHEISLKCHKMQMECKDYQRIVSEQSEIMKALNKTIEAKNDQIGDYKAKIEFNKNYTQNSFIENNQEIKLCENNESLCTFPFHNPLFGSIQSLYR